ncbi:MAG TPA: retropepsin-like aspartic protease, partial [Vicinamibacterales bacterium]
MGGWLLVMWGLTWAAAPPLAAARSWVAPFADGSAGAVVLEARVNGQGPFRFLLDTGSARTAVSPRMAAAVGAPVVARTTMGSAAGSRELLVVRIDTLEVGPVLAPDLLASVVSLDHIDDGDLDGVIGHDVLAAIRYTIDFRERRVAWWPTDALTARGPTLRVRSSGGRLLLSLPQRDSVLQLVPDTGASALLLFAPHPALPLTLRQETATLT